MSSKSVQLVIRGVVTTASLAHQTSPSEPGAQIKTNVMSKNGLVRGVPYITANSVRGLIRRAAADVLLERLAASKSRIHRSLYLSIVRGAYARTGVQAGGATIEQMLAAADHVFGGLFGGGGFMHHSAFDLKSDLLPVALGTKDFMPSDVQIHAIEEDPSKLLTMAVLAPRDDFATLPPMAREVVENLHASYSDHMQTKLGQAMASKAAKDAQQEKLSKDDLNNFAMTECIIPGVPLYFNITSGIITEAQAGLLLQGVQRWANRNALGGGSARGRGAFVPSLALVLDGQRITETLLVGDAPSLALAEDARIKELIDACDAALDQQATPEKLGMVYPIEVGKALAKSKKAAKAGDPDADAKVA